MKIRVFPIAQKEPDYLDVCCNRMIYALQKSVLFFHSVKDNFGFETELQEADDLEELSEPQFVQIDFCPFCGTQIERML